MNDSWNMDALIAIIREAGEYARAHWHEREVSAKTDNTLVTDIDIAIEKRIKKELERLTPNGYFIGEESIKQQSEEYIRDAFRHACWIVDPIDGTAPFAFGFDTWAVSIGYMVKGVLEEGCIYLPVSGELIISKGETVYILYTRDTHPLHNDSPAVFTTPPTPYTRHGIISVSQDITRHGIIDTADSVQSIGSCVYSVAQYLLGRYRGIVTKVKLWDIAGSIPLLEKMGHKIFLNDMTLVGHDSISSSFLVDAQEQTHTRWGMRGHVFIGKSDAQCKELIRATTYPFS